MSRSGGLLLHPSSLAGPYGIGDMGPAARELLAWMDSAELGVWQMLPLTPVDHHGSPYASGSAFAFEPLLLSIDDLVEDGWLEAGQRTFATGRGLRVDWERVATDKRAMLDAAAARVVAADAHAGYAEGRPEVASWALYRVIERERSSAWFDWPEPLRDRDPDALAAEHDRLSEAYDRELALQWLCEQQWGRIREDALQRGIELWGDVPFFVSLGSSDVWCHAELFRLDGERRPAVVSGVPPDAFTADGQHWGHPHYDVEAHVAEGYRWWRARLGRALQMVDRVRIDHFRGIDAVWEIPAGASAADGAWAPSLGRRFLDAIRAEYPTLPFLAEDLGVITDSVRVLRDAFELPGMAILQFAFDGDPHNLYLPHNLVRNQICYTGTHDNDTTAGWYDALDDGSRHRVRSYLACTDPDAPWALMRAAWRSVCDVAVVPLQDLLGLGSESRTNIPGRADGNWGWRAGPGALSLDLAERVADELRVSGRVARP